MKKIKCRIDIIVVSLKGDNFSCSHEVAECESLTEGHLVIRQSKNNNDPNYTILSKLTPLYD